MHLFFGHTSRCIHGALMVNEVCGLGSQVSNLPHVEMITMTALVRAQQEQQGLSDLPSV